jgi:hypothetical protein
MLLKSMHALKYRLAQLDPVAVAPVMCKAAYGTLYDDAKVRFQTQYQPILVREATIQTKAETYVLCFFSIFYFNGFLGLLGASST